MSSSSGPTIGPRERLLGSRSRSIGPSHRAAQPGNAALDASMTRSRPELSRDSLVASVARAVEAVRAARAAQDAAGRAAGPQGSAQSAEALGAQRTPERAVSIGGRRSRRAAGLAEPAAVRPAARAGRGAAEQPSRVQPIEALERASSAAPRLRRAAGVARNQALRSGAPASTPGSASDSPQGDFGARPSERWTKARSRSEAAAATRSVGAPQGLGPAASGKAAHRAAGRSAHAEPADEAERRRLWRAYRRAPNDETRNRLVEAYQPLVREIVSRFGARLPRSVDRGDLATAGNMGLIAAIQSFDGRRGVRFEAYGDRRIRGALLDELRTQDWLPRPWRRRLEQHKQVHGRLCAELGREPHDEELAAALGLSVAAYQSLFGLAWPLAPSGVGRASEGDEDAWLGELEVVPDPRAKAADEELTREELLALCAQRMSPQEHRIVYLKYWQELSLREIGAITGLSESRICKIHTQLLERLAERLAGHAADL